MTYYIPLKKTKIVTIETIQHLAIQRVCKSELDHYYPLCDFFLYFSFVRSRLLYLHAQEADFRLQKRKALFLCLSFVVRRNTRRRAKIPFFFAFSPNKSLPLFPSDIFFVFFCACRVCFFVLKEPCSTVDFM